MLTAHELAVVVLTLEMEGARNDSVLLSSTEIWLTLAGADALYQIACAQVDLLAVVVTETGAANIVPGVPGRVPARVADVSIGQCVALSAVIRTSVPRRFMNGLAAASTQACHGHCQR